METKVVKIQAANRAGDVGEKEVEFTRSAPLVSALETSKIPVPKPFADWDEVIQCALKHKIVEIQAEVRPVLQKDGDSRPTKRGRRDI